LSEKPSRLGEMALPKREFAKPLGPQFAISPSESLQLEREHSSCLNEGS